MGFKVQYSNQRERDVIYHKNGRNFNKIYLKKEKKTRCIVTLSGFFAIIV